MTKAQLLELEKEMYTKLKIRGQQLIGPHIPDLNRISDVHIRKDKDTVYRREEDFDEMCVLLALIEMKRELSDD